MEDLSLDKSISNGILKRSVAIKFSFINYWKSKYKSNANKVYGWYKVWQNIASRAAKLRKLVGHKHKLSLDVRVPARSESTMRSCIGWGCSPAPVPHVRLPWHANLSEQGMLALLLGSESISFHGRCYLTVSGLQWVCLETSRSGSMSKVAGSSRFQNHLY